MNETISLSLSLNNRAGLHARPASMFVQTCNKFSSQIKVTYNDLTVDGKQILGVMSLGVQCGGEFVLSVCGNDAQDAIDALSQLVADNFGET